MSILKLSLLVFYLNCLLLRERFRAHSLIHYILIFYILHFSLRSTKVLNINYLIIFLWRRNWIFNIALNNFIIIFNKRNFFTKIGFFDLIIYIILSLISNLVFIFKMRSSGLIIKILNVKFLDSSLTWIFLCFILD